MGRMELPGKGKAEVSSAECRVNKGDRFSAPLTLVPRHSSDDWIEKRMRSIAVRDELTDEWKKRGVKEQREYAILTAGISEATFGLTPSQSAKKLKQRRECR